MKAKTAIHFAVPGQPPETLKTPEALPDVLFKLERLPEQGTLGFERITPAGKIRKCFIPKPGILRLEELA